MLAYWLQFAANATPMTQIPCLWRGLFLQALSSIQPGPVVPRNFLPEFRVVADPEPCRPVFFAAFVRGVRRPAAARSVCALAVFSLIPNRRLRCIAHRSSVFSGGGERALVVKVIASAHENIRLAGYSFTSPAVVKALIDAKKRGVDVRLLIDDRGNRGATSQAARRLVKGAGIALRVISIYAIYHDKYIVADGTTSETGAFNYS